MKLFFKLSAAFIVAVRLASAQEAPAPAKPAKEEPTQVAPEPVKTSGQDVLDPVGELSLIPETPLPSTKPKSSGVVVKKKSSTEQAADDLQARVRLRQVKTKALQDPKFDAEWAEAQAATTNAGKRDLLTRYYNHLYDRMAALDPKLKPRLEELRQSLTWRIGARGKKSAQQEQAVLGEDLPDTRGY
jgi:hypothetical protein